MDKTYPFRIKTTARTKVAKINADSYCNALNKVLSLHPGKIVKTRFALNVDGYQTPIKLDGTQAPVILKRKPFKLIINTMDLITAKVEAAKQSRAQHKKMYIVVDDEEECIVTSVPTTKKDYITLTSFVNGSEVLIENEEAEISKTENKLSTTKKSKTMSAETTTVKKVAKKAPAKKVVAAKKSAVTEKKVQLKPAKGQVTMSIKAVIAAVTKGSKAFNVAGKPLPIGYLSKFTDPSKEIIVSLTKAE